MNRKRILLFSLLISLSLSWLGCHKSEKVIVAGPPPAGPVELKLKWPAGRRMLQNLDLKQNSEMSMPGMPNPIKQNMTMGQQYELSVLRELADGGHEIQMEIRGTRMTVASGNQTVIDFDSSKKSSGTNPLAAVFIKMTGAQIKFLMDASNEVWKVEGIGDLQKQLSSGGQKDPTGILKSMFSEDYFRQMMNYGKSLPPGPVVPGDTWPVHMEIPMGDLGTMSMDHTYTFKSWEKRNQHNCAVIAFEGTVKGKPGQNSKMGGMSLLIDGGKSSGETWFDLENGMFVETTIGQDIKMYITVPNQARGKAPTAPMQTITNLMNQIINVKMELEK